MLENVHENNYHRKMNGLDWISSFSKLAYRQIHSMHLICSFHSNLL